jgi:hypothetical protein
MLVYFNGNSCTSVYTNNGTDINNSQVNAITHIGTTYYYTGLGIAGIYDGYNVGDVPIEQTYEFFDICIQGTQLGIQNICHHLYLNSSVGAYCPIAQEEICMLGCKDNSTYWESIQSSPIDRNYSAYCTLNYNGNPTCANLNDIKCNGTQTIQTCLKDSFDILKWTTTSTCINSATCTNGVCYLPGETPPNDDGTDSIFSVLSLQTKYWLMMIICVVALLFFTILLASYGDAQAGVIAGLVISMILSLFLSIVWNLTLIIPIIYIIFGGLAVAFLLRRTVTG